MLFSGPSSRNHEPKKLSIPKVLPLQDVRMLPATGFSRVRPDKQTIAAPSAVAYRFNTSVSAERRRMSSGLTDRVAYGRWTGVSC